MPIQKTPTLCIVKTERNSKPKTTCTDAMLEKQKEIANPKSPHTPALCGKIDGENSTTRLHCTKVHRVRTSLLLLAPSSPQKAPLAARRASCAWWVTAWLVVSILPAALPARSATSSAHTALNRARGRSDSRTVIVRVGVSGAGAGCEEWIWRRTGVTPGLSARGTLIRAGVFGSTRAGGVLTDTVLRGRRTRAHAEKVEGAACGGAVGGTDHGESVAEDVADVEVAARVGFEYRTVGGGLAVGAHVGYADLAGEAGSEICTAGCRAGVGAAVEGVVGTLGVAGPGDGEPVGLSVACAVGDGEDAEGSCEEGQKCNELMDLHLVGGNCRDGPKRKTGNGTRYVAGGN